jgi:3-phenylpropionate/trans-cinnamate dioxygenase ferredoxin reductase component
LDRELRSAFGGRARAEDPPLRCLNGDVNVWDTSDIVQALVRGGRTVDPGRLADPSVPLDELAGD